MHGFIGIMYQCSCLLYWYIAWLLVPCECVVMGLQTQLVCHVYEHSWCAKFYGQLSCDMVTDVFNVPF